MIGFDEFMKEQVLFIAPFKKLAEDAYLVIEERFSDKKDWIYELYFKSCI